MNSSPTRSPREQRSAEDCLHPPEKGPLEGGEERSPCPAPERLSKPEQEKAEQILQACEERDIKALTALATSRYGLVQDEVRRKAWPILLGSSRCSSTSEAAGEWKLLPPHREEDQVGLDVNRSFVYYPKNASDKQLEELKQQLLVLITQVLRRYPDLCYFQGYHDIVQVLLLVLGSEDANPAVTRLSLLRLRDFMLPSLDAAMVHVKLLPAILKRADPALFAHLRLISPFFAISQTLTLYAHDIEEYGDIARLFDFLLAREAVISLYLFAVIILNRKDELLQFEPYDTDMLHFTLSKLPQPLDLEALISQTTSLFSQYPPESLPAFTWRKIPSASVLKTTRDPANIASQSLEEGEKLYAAQAKQQQRTQALKKLEGEIRRGLWRYRRPALLSVAVAVGVLAWWLARPGGSLERLYRAGSMKDVARMVFAFPFGRR